jgi:hypothetical protein
MKLSKIILAIAFVFFYTSIFSQSVGGVKFENYQAKISTNNKAKINFTSCKLGKKYQNFITEKYKNENINFGGHYVVIIWGLTGTSNGVMIDKNTGLIYSIPLTPENSFQDSPIGNDDFIKFQKNSYLFYSYSTLINKNDDKKIDLHYEFFKFDENTKKFKMISTLNKTVESEDN